MVILGVRTSAEQSFSRFINSIVSATPRKHWYSAVFTIRHILCFGLTSFLDACLTSETKFLFPYRNPWLSGKAPFGSCHWILLVGWRGYCIRAPIPELCPLFISFSLSTLWAKFNVIWSHMGAWRWPRTVWGSSTSLNLWLRHDHHLHSNYKFQSRGHGKQIDCKGRVQFFGMHLHKFQLF